MLDKRANENQHLEWKLSRKHLSIQDNKFNNNFQVDERVHIYNSKQYNTNSNERASRTFILLVFIGLLFSVMCWGEMHQ